MDFNYNSSVVLFVFSLTSLHTFSNIGLVCRHDFNLTKTVYCIIITNRPFGTFSIRLIDMISWWLLLVRSFWTVLVVIALVFFHQQSEIFFLHHESSICSHIALPRRTFARYVFIDIETNSYACNLNYLLYFHRS
jgi:hypothetical protein